MKTDSDHIPDPEDRRRRAATACLRDVHNLVDTWFAHLVDIPSYQEGLVSAEVVREECVLVFTRLLNEIGDLPVPAEAQMISERVGHSRAFWGIPLSDLLSAIRLDYRVLWDGLVSHLGADDSAAIAVSVPRLLDAVERHSQETTKAYNLTQYGMTQARQDEHRLWFTRLIDTDGRNHVLNVRACEVLSLKIHNSFTVFSETRISDTALDDLLDELRRRRIIAHHYAIEDGEILVTQLTTEERRSIDEWLQSSASVASLGPFKGVSLVPTAVRLLLTLSAYLPNPSEGVNRCEDQWPLAALCAPLASRTMLRQIYIHPLRKLSDAERRLLSETAEAYLTTGSVAETAKALFCHRNTAANRLDQLAETTGLDLRRPRDAAVYLLATASAQPSPMLAPQMTDA